MVKQYKNWAIDTKNYKSEQISRCEHQKDEMSVVLCTWLLKQF